MLRQVEDLNASQSQMTKEEIQDKLIRWDQDQGQAMKVAERKLQTPPKKYAWSPILKNTAMHHMEILETLFAQNNKKSQLLQYLLSVATESMDK